jgi:multiple sugar transport system permease protein
MFYLFRFSFAKVGFEMGRIRPIFVGFQNYSRLFQDPYFWQAFRHTLYFTVVSVPVGFFIALPLSLALNRITRGVMLTRTLILIPWVISPAISAAIWKWLYNDQYGMINYVLMRLGVISSFQVWLGDPRLAINSLVVCDIWEWVPFSVLVLLAGLKTIPTNLYEACTVDGGNLPQGFWHITLPLLKPSILILLLLRTMFTLRVFGFVFTLTGGGPGRATEVIATYMYRKGMLQMKFGYSSTISVVLFFITAIVCLVYIKALGQKET